MCAWIWKIIVSAVLKRFLNFCMFIYFVYEITLSSPFDYWRSFFNGKITDKSNDNIWQISATVQLSNERIFPYRNYYCLLYWKQKRKAVYIFHVKKPKEFILLKIHLA